MCFKNLKKIRLNPPQIAAAGFLAVIITGTALLSLPIAASGSVKLSFLDNLFLSTSATCVTGLAVQNIGTAYSTFGKIIMICLMQLGGLGIMTFSTAFAIMLGRKLSISENLTIQSALGRTKIEGLRELILYIFVFTFSLEAIGVAALYYRWITTTTWAWDITLGRAIYHSVSAFCNAGLSLFSDSLTAFRSDWVVMFIFCSLIVLGGMGFIVCLDLTKLFAGTRNRHPLLSRISLQTKIVLMITAILILLGALGVFIFENNHTLSAMPAKEKFLSCIFTSITPRTAGFNVIETGDLRPTTLFMLIILMFIGASPGSTGGGIKTVTFGIMLAALYSMFYNKDRIDLFKKTIPRRTFRNAVLIIFLAFGVVIVSTFLLSITENASAKSANYFLGVLFESTSAFGTVGLSTGITPHLTLLGKLIIIITMYIGRVGPLTLALAVAMRKEKVDYAYPEENLMVG